MTASDDLHQNSRKISVVIPTYNEEATIAECISSIQGGNVAPLEIIVADGLSSDRTQEIARERGAKVVANPQRTAAAGRNVGFRAARGEIIAFTDGDCVVSPDWLGAFERAFADPEVAVVSGRVTPREPRNHYEEFWNNLNWKIIMAFDDEPYTVTERSLRQGVITASCAYRKNVLEELGGFDTWFGNNAEDVDLGWRALAAGFKTVYIPKAEIYASGALTMKELERKAFRDGYSSSKLQKRYGGLINFDKNIYRLLRKNLRARQWASIDAKMERHQLLWHLLGKYYGSLRTGIINV